MLLPDLGVHNPSCICALGCCPRQVKMFTAHDFSWQLGEPSSPPCRAAEQYRLLPNLCAMLATALPLHRRWFTRSRAMWEGCTRIPCDYDVPKGVRLVYCLEMGHYLQVRQLCPTADGC